MKNFKAIQELLKNSPTFYLIAVNMDSTYGYVNTRYSDIFEQQHGELIGKHYAITVHPDDTSICAKVAEKCFNSPNDVFPAIIRKHDGKGGYIATQWDYKAMVDEMGNPQGIFCIGYDITAFLQKTSALEELEFIQSHVIRKPIANLVGLVGLLKDLPANENQAQLTTMIHQAVAELDLFMSPGSRTATSSGSPTQF